MFLIITHVNTHFLKSFLLQIRQCKPLKFNWIFVRFFLQKI